MIGSVRFLRSGIRHEARLDEDGTWTMNPPLPEPEGGEVANILESIAAMHDSPADGPFGPAEIDKGWMYLTNRYGVASRHLVPKTPTGPEVRP